jgi:ribonuclease HIII
MLDVKGKLKVLIAEYNSLIQAGSSHDAAIKAISAWAHPTRISGLNKYLTQQQVDVIIDTHFESVAKSPSTTIKATKLKPSS